MGYWRITVDGCGCHHNGKREIDANLAAADFVAELKAQGHQLSAARFESITDNSGTGAISEYTAGNIDFLAPEPETVAASA